MKKLLLIIILLTTLLAVGKNYKCPEDNCTLNYYETLYCQGDRCRTVKVYKCGCCERTYWVYQ